jgi:hypothetical protein
MIDIPGGIPTWPPLWVYLSVGAVLALALLIALYIEGRRQ